MKTVLVRKRNLGGRHTFQDIPDSLAPIFCEEELIFFPLKKAVRNWMEKGKEAGVRI